MKKHNIKEKDIAEVIEEVCPYCACPKNGKLSCCGENHWENGYLMLDGELWLEHEVSIEKEN